MTVHAEKKAVDQISTAAKMAGDWWAERLDYTYADKREAFSAAVAALVEQALRGEFYWTWGEGKKPGDGIPVSYVETEVDYDPQGLLLDAVREVIDPECRGFCYSARDILPLKHSLDVKPEMLVPKEGYGNWTATIPVRATS